MLFSPKSVTGAFIFVKRVKRVMAFSQNVALAMVNKCVKFHKISLKSSKVLVYVKVFS